MFVFTKILSSSIVIDIFLFSILVFKMSNLHQTSKGDDEESDSEDDDDEEEDEEKKPEMTFAVIKNQGCVNRIKVSIFMTIIKELICFIKHQIILQTFFYLEKHLSAIYYYKKEKTLFTKNYF